MDRFYNASTDFLDRHLEAGRGAKTAIRTLDRDWSYAEVAEAAERFAGALKELGVEIENRVALLLPDGPEFAIAFFGAIRLGAVPVPLQATLLPADYARFLHDSRAKVAVVGAGLADAVRSIRDQLPDLRQLVVVGDRAPGEESFSDAVTAAARLGPARTSPDDMAFWLYTSGTSGLPKGIVHLQHDLRFSAQSYGEGVLGLQSDDVIYSHARLYFAYGLGNALLYPFWTGAATVLVETPSPEVLVAVLRRLKPTVYFAVPSTFAAALAWVGADFSSVRLCVSSGERLASTIVDEWKQRTGLEILNALGSSECCNPFISSRPGDARRDGAGLPVPGYEVRIMDAEGQELPDGESGELWVKGDSFFAGYWNQHELTKRTILGEWVRTGDRCLRGSDGYVHHLGRIDDMLKVGGTWVSPFEIEEVIARHPCVHECAVVGELDGQLLTRVAAYVVPRVDCRERAGLERELRRHVRASLPSIKCPRDFHVVAQLPRTASGKIQRHRLRGPEPVPAAPPQRN